MMTTCLMGVAVLIASTGVLGSAACTGAVRAKADSIAADAPAAILVRQVPVKCECINPPWLKWVRGAKLGAQDDTRILAFCPRRESFVTGSGILDGDETSQARSPEGGQRRSEEHTSELQSQSNLVCRLLLEIKRK